MTYLKKRTITFLVKAAGILSLFIFLSLPAFAQASFPLKMKLTDKQSGEALAFATVSLTPKGEKSPVKYVLSASDGSATIEKVRKGKYLLKVEMMGYETFQKEIDLLKSSDLGEIQISQDAEVLEAASVSAVGNPIIVKKDTIEYTASSFKTSDNDMLENLLKKLPGVEIGTDGTITANGETIKKIMIDGKTFFLDDPQLATKNIPAKIVEKVKVIEKKSDQAQFTGIDDGNEETVIDLSVKKGMMNGWFGNIMAGGGHDAPDKGYYGDGQTFASDGWRYQGAAMVGRFTDKSQLSFILNGNNTNNRGFNDLSAGMMQGMRGSGRGMGRNYGGWGGNGITTSWMAGVNGAATLLGGNMDLGGNYLYNGSSKSVMEQSSKTTYLDDGSNLIYNNDGHNLTNTQGHRVGIRLDHKFNDKVSILFEPQFNFGYGDFSEYSNFLTMSERDALRDTTNKGFNENNGSNRNWSASGFFLYRHRLGKPGRTLSFNVSYNFSRNNLDGFNQSNTRTFESTDIFSDELINQRYSTFQNTSSLSGRITYTEPIVKNFFLEANYSYSWNRSKSVRETYDSASDIFSSDGSHLIYNPVGEVLSDTYSNNILNRYQNHSAGINFQYQKEKFSARIGANVQPTLTHNVTNGQEYDSKVVNWSPSASVRYDITDNSMFRMFYFGRSSQPSTSQLMPVPDNSDPLNVSFGNPYLLPYFTHNARLMYGYTNRKTFTSVHARIGGSLIQNPVVYARWYENGAQYSLPVNGPNSGSADFNLMVNTPIAKSKFSIFSMTVARYSNSSTYMGVTGKFETDKYYDKESESFDYALFREDFASDKGLFDNNKTHSLSIMERLRFTFRSDLVEVSIGGRMRYSQSWYSAKSAANQKATFNNKVDASMNWTIPGGINLIADLDYNWYNGYSTPQDDEFIFNAEITKLLFKKKFTLALKAYDIFNQAKNLSVVDESNYHQEVRNNTLGRYVILSLTYRFGNFNGARGAGPHSGGPHGPRR